MPITIYPGSMKKRNANGSYSDLVPAIATDPEVLDDFAEEYSTSETYNIGDYCIHNSDLYKCNTNNTTGTWNNNAWDRVTVGDELADHKNTLTQKADESSLADRRTGSTNTGAQIETGTFFYLDGTLKRAIATIAQNASFTAQNCETVTAGGLNDLLEPKLIDNANNAITTGRYKTTNSGTNTPYANHWVLDVYQYTNGEVVQIAISTEASSKLYYRTYYYGSWSSWKNVLTGVNDSATDTTDASGRILLPIAANKLLSVIAQNTAYWCVPRYHADGTLVYIYNIGTFTPVTGTSVTLDYNYLV